MPFFKIFSNKREKNLEKLRIIADNRERNSLVVPYLIEEGFIIEWKHLPVADYLVKDFAIERKTISDLKSSIVDKRIFSQALELKQYDKCLVLVEGILENESKAYGLHENAFRGALFSIIFDYKVPIIFSKNEKDSARYISVLARRGGKAERNLRPSKILLTMEERKQFILEGFPNIGPVKARNLIKKFGSLKAIFNAPEEQLKEILGKRAKEFLELLE